jgi:hypothetical protein
VAAAISAGETLKAAEPPEHQAAVSSIRIRSESKAQTDEKAQQPREVVRILKRLVTQLSGLIWGFEMSS